MLTLYHKIVAKTAPSEDLWLRHQFVHVFLLLRGILAFLAQRYNNSFISCFGLLVLISFLYIHLIIILIASSKGTLLDTTSNDIIWYPGGVSCLFSVFINKFLLLFVYWDWPSGFNIWAKYLTSLYVTVLLFEIIGLSGKAIVSSIVFNFV